MDERRSSAPRPRPRRAALHAGPRARRSAGGARRRRKGGCAAPASDVDPRRRGEVEARRRRRLPTLTPTADPPSIRRSPFSGPDPARTPGPATARADAVGFAGGRDHDAARPSCSARRPAPRCSRSATPRRPARSRAPAARAAPRGPRPGARAGRQRLPRGARALQHALRRYPPARRGPGPRQRRRPGRRALGGALRRAARRALGRQRLQRRLHQRVPRSWSTSARSTPWRWTAAASCSGRAAGSCAVQARLARRGLTFPAGSCPNVAVGGHALGGGFGPLRPRGRPRARPDPRDPRRHRRRPQAARHRADGEDLFWALRGGGGSFGIVVAFEIDPVRATDGAWFRVTYPAAQREEALAAFDGFAPGDLAELTSILSLTRRRRAGLRPVPRLRARLRRLLGPLTRVPARA